MRIFRGNVGVDLSLEEFDRLIEDDEKMDDLLNILYELELDEAMNYDEKELKEFEEELFEEVAEQQLKEKSNNDVAKMKRILGHLDKYGK